MTNLGLFDFELGLYIKVNVKGGWVGWGEGSRMTNFGLFDFELGLYIKFNVKGGWVGWGEGVE